MSEILSREKLTEVLDRAIYADDYEHDRRIVLAHDAAIRAENARLRADYTNACSTIAAMHAAAVGEVRGSTLGVVEDVATVREAANRLRQKMRETYADHRYMNVWATAQGHLGPYTGPNWIAEAESLDAALAATEPAPEHETFEGHPHDASCRECWPQPAPALPDEVREAAEAFRKVNSAQRDDSCTDAGCIVCKRREAGDRLLAALAARGGRS